MDMNAVLALLQVESMTRNHPTYKLIHDKAVAALDDIVAQLSPQKVLKEEPDGPKAIPASEVEPPKTEQTGSEERKA